MSPGAGRERGDRHWPSDLVETVRGAVSVHRTSDERESGARVHILEYLAVLPRPFDEETDLVHVTGSAVVVGRRGTVLHRHKRLHRWMQPGGHIDPGESPWEAALRESEEETGLALRHPDDGPRLIHMDVHDAANGHTHLDLRYFLLAPDEDPAPPPGESPDARWYGWDEALVLADVALVGALERARREPEVASMAGPGKESGTEPGRKRAGGGHDQGAGRGREGR